MYVLPFARVLGASVLTSEGVRGREGRSEGRRRRERGVGEGKERTEGSESKSEKEDGGRGGKIVCCVCECIRKSE
jgi:hypothetical protein